MGRSRLIFVSGQVPLDASGELAGDGSMGAQADQVFRNIVLVLQACGSGLHEVVKVTSFVTDVGVRATFNKVRNRTSADSQPVSTFVGSRP